MTGALAAHAFASAGVLTVLYWKPLWLRAAGPC